MFEMGRLTVCVCGVLCVSVVARLQSFLPQMAEANQRLMQQIHEAPAGHFDIESIEGAQRVIEMVRVTLH